MITLPAAAKSKQEEWKTILAIAENNEYSTEMIPKFKTKVITRKQKQNQQQENKIILDTKMGNIHTFQPINKTRNQSV
jgi:hypothetical protein